jgi:hypothetical protein
MGKWRQAFEHGRPSSEDIEYDRLYTFGPPANEEQLAFAETTLGLRLPPEVRDLLSEFNGVWSTSESSRRRGEPPDIKFLDVEHMSVLVPQYFGAYDFYPPESFEYRKIVFVHQINGYSVLHGVCVEDLAGFRAGEVVRLDAELEAAFPSLIEFVRLGLK